MERTLLKGLAVLEALVAHGKPCGVSELAAKIKLSKSNAFRLLNTLAAAGFVTIDDSRYSASLKTWELGIKIIEGFDVRSVAHPLMERVARESKENVRLAILDAARLESVLVDAIESSHAVRTFTEIASRMPAYCTSSGKALLAFQDAETIERSRRNLKPLTRWTITDPEKFIRHLEKVRRDGYATNLREYSEQVRSIGAPIFAPDGSAIASISIAAPVDRMTAPVMRKLTRLLCAAAQEISAKMRSPTNVVDLYSAPRQRDLARPRRSPGRPLRRAQA